jgi:lipopolysaccharide assembly outer membrane protein LptD (OstA)
MKFLLLCLTIPCLFPALNSQAVCQETKAQPERLHFLYPYPDSHFKGRFEFAASSAQRVHIQSSEGTILQLRGNVEVATVVCADPCVKSPLVLHADAIDYNEKTGEINATGNVHSVLTQPVPDMKFKAPR